MSIEVGLNAFFLFFFLGSVFYNLSDNTGSFFSRGALLFFAILMNTFSSALEVSACLVAFLFVEI